MAAQRQIPGGPFVNEVATAQRQIPGAQFINETISAGVTYYAPAIGDTAITGVAIGDTAVTGIALGDTHLWP